MSSRTRRVGGQRGVGVTVWQEGAEKMERLDGEPLLWQLAMGDYCMQVRETFELNDRQTYTKRQSIFKS
jgi:hypothetical protein